MNTKKQIEARIKKVSAKGLPEAVIASIVSDMLPPLDTIVRRHKEAAAAEVAAFLVKNITEMSVGREFGVLVTKNILTSSSLSSFSKAN